MLHPDTEVRFINDQIGHGVFATRLIPKGTLTWVMDKFDRVYTEAEVRQLEPVYQDILERYCFRNCQGLWVFCWDNTRFINHSFQSNCVATPYGCEIAVRDIHPGEQITNDYGFFNIIEPFDMLPEPGSSRTRVMPDDLVTYAEMWDTLLADAYPRFCAVPQPLAGLLPPEHRQALEQVSRGDVPPLSIQTNYFADPALVKETQHA